MYSQETTYLFMSAISQLMVAIRCSSSDGALKKPKQSPLVNQRFKGVINSISDSLHNTACMFDFRTDNSTLLSNIEYHIDMIALSKDGLVAFEEFNEALNITKYRLALDQITDALNAMKREVLDTTEITETIIQEMLNCFKVHGIDSYDRRKRLYNHLVCLEKISLDNLLFLDSGYFELKLTKFLKQQGHNMKLTFKPDKDTLLKILLNENDRQLVQTQLQQYS